jgi:CheY-like chemotaxis protein
MEKRQSVNGIKQGQSSSLNATVTVRQVSEGGTRLTFTVPVSQAPEDASQETPLFNRLFPLLAGKKILVVDDQPLNRLLAMEILRPYGPELFEAENGSEALDCLGTHDFDMVLMDVQMPVMDGIDATRIIRRKIGESLPVIALSANSVSGNIDRCMAAGMNAFLAKPYRAEALMDVISSQLRAS